MRARGPSVIGRRFRWNRCRVDPATWVPRRLRRGSPTFFEESRGKEHQGQAPGPRGSWPAHSRSLVLGIVVFGTIVGLFPPVCQDRFGTHFRGKICWKAFLRKKVSKSGHVHGHRNSPTTAPLRPTTPKPASGNERALKKGVQGAKPPALFPPAFSGESRAPARSRAGNHVAGPTLRRSRRHHLPTAARQSRSRLPPNQKGRPQGLPFSPIPCYALVTVFRMPLPAVSLGLVSKPSFS